MTDGTIGARIKTARTFAGLSRAQLASAIDMSAEMVGRYERDEWQPRTPVVAAVAAATGVPVSFFEHGFAGPEAEVREILELREALAELRAELLSELEAIRAELPATPSPEDHAAEADLRLGGSAQASEGTPGAGDGSGAGRE